VFTAEGTLELYNVMRYYGGQYEPELFSAAMFTKNNVHFMCLHTGSVLVTDIKAAVLRKILKLISYKYSKYIFKYI